MIVTLYDELVGAATIDGAWTYVGTTTPNPAPPVLYNDSIDFTGYANGDYIYRYTVTDTLTATCTDTADVTVSLYTYAAVLGDTCVIPRGIGLSTTVDSSINPNGASGTVALVDVRSTCPGPGSYTLDPTVLPTGWTFSVIDQDIWFKITVDLSCCATGVSISATVHDSAVSDPADVLTNPSIAIYNGACGALSLMDSNPPSSSTSSTATGYKATPSASEVFYIRIGWEDGNEGEFSLDYTVIGY